MSTRVSILSRACNLTSGNRDKSYGSPTSNMSVFANLLEGYFRSRGWITGDHNGIVTSQDAAFIMALSKMGRTIGQLPYHEDNYIDGAAYFAIAGECREAECAYPGEEPSVQYDYALGEE